MSMIRHGYSKNVEIGVAVFSVCLALLEIENIRNSHSSKFCLSSSVTLASKVDALDNKRSGR